MVHYEQTRLLRQKHNLCRYHKNVHINHLLSFGISLVSGLIMHCNRHSLTSSVFISPSADIEASTVCSYGPLLLLNACVRS